MSNDKAYIYGLIDPTTLGIRYIGKSFSPRVRFLKHLSDDTGCQKDSWIMSLRTMGITPILTILEETTKAEVLRAEKRWIATGIAATTLKRKVGDGLVGRLPKLCAAGVIHNSSGADGSEYRLVGQS